MKLIKFELFENANATNGNIYGMGNIGAPQPQKVEEEKKEIPDETRIPEPEEQPEEPQNESVVSFKDFNLNEDGGVANATLGNMAGMGNVTAPTVSAIPGDVAGSTAGSGDLVACDKGTYFGTKPKKHKKETKEKRHKGTETAKEEMYVTKFEDWLLADATNENVVNENMDIISKLVTAVENQQEISQVFDKRLDKLEEITKHLSPEIKFKRIK